jgi:hypothetical protein
VAIFDNDGTLWTEKPMPIELGFILQRLPAAAEQDPSLRGEAAVEGRDANRDYAWLGDVVTRHYHGDDSDVKVLLGGILHAFAGMTIDAYTAAADTFLRHGQHPTLRAPFTRLRLPADGRAPALSSRRTASPPSSPRAAIATSCAW